MIDRKKIEDFLVNEIFLKRLELDEDGFTPDDFSEDTLVFDKSGLGIDSVDALDLLVGIEKQYNFEPVAIDGDYIQEKCSSIASIIDMIIERMAEKAETANAWLNKKITLSVDWGVF